MMDLGDIRWANLQHGYGSAGDIPSLLKQLHDLPADHGDDPWYSLWSALVHQGDVYSASFAAVPHVIAALSRDPAKADGSYFQFPAWVDICRRKNGTPIPEELAEDYHRSLAQLPSLVLAASSKEWDNDFSRCVLAALAVAKGQHELAEVLLELSPDHIEAFSSWLDAE